MSRVKPITITQPAKATVKTIAKGFMVLAAVVGVVFVLVGLYGFMKSWSSTTTNVARPTYYTPAPVVTHAPPPVVQTNVYREKCGTGVIYENVLVTQNEMEINPHPHHCNPRWVVLKGTMKPVGTSTFGQQVPGGAVGDVRDGLTRAVVATTTAETRINYQICPATHRSPGWC